jgi:hypothetical protein
MSQAPIFPLLLAAYPALYLASANAGQAPGASVAMVAIVLVFGASALVLLARTLMPTWHHAALAAAAVTAIFFAFGPLHALGERALLDAVERGDTPLLDAGAWTSTSTAVTILLLGACVWALSRIPQATAVRLTGALNLVSVLLVTFVGVQLAMAQGEARSSQTPAAVSRAAAPVSADSPDIYYVVLDGYARQDVLEHYYALDNVAFVDGLRKRGFAVNDASTSNYYWTFLSLASVLNHRYLDDLVPGGVDRESTDRTHLYEVIRQNATARFLRNHGYRILHMRSTWGATRENPYADIELSCGDSPFGDEFVRAVADTSWLRAVMSTAFVDLARCHSSNFTQLGALGATAGPKFVFAHFMLPHHPYLFDAEGRVLRNATLSSQLDFQKRLWEDRKAYVEQLRYVNRRTLEMVDAIRSTSRRPPIILIQSDHGPGLIKGLELPEQMRIRFANFSAQYLPDAPRGLVPSDDSAVNLFPRILNHYFGAQLPIMPNRHFYSDFRLPLALREVGTSELAALTDQPAP